MLRGIKELLSEVVSFFISDSVCYFLNEVIFRRGCWRLIVKLTVERLFIHLLLIG